jgi:integrase
VAGESVLWVDPAEIPADDDIGKLGGALAAGLHGERDELMAYTAAYSGMRWGELTALTIPQIDQAARVITVDRKVVEIAGHLYMEAPKNRKSRRTIYPRRTPDGYPLAGRLAARIEAARVEQEAGTNPLGLIFPSPTGKHWRSSNFNRNVLQRAYLAAGWRDSGGSGRWTWHSLRHVFCTTALFVWKFDATDVSRMAGHANVRITLDIDFDTIPAYEVWGAKPARRLPTRPDHPGRCHPHRDPHSPRPSSGAHRSGRAARIAGIRRHPRAGRAGCPTT